MDTKAKVGNVEIPSTQLEAFCRRWDITDVELFGSALRDDFGPESDIDLLVTFAPNARWNLFDLVDMEDELTTIFGRKVDLVGRRAIEHSQNWIRRDEILRTAEPIYVAR